MMFTRSRRKGALRRGLAGLCALCMLLCAVPVSALEADEISAPSAVLMDAGSGTVLFEKEAHLQRPCASVTKVMTLLLVFEAIDSGKISLDDSVMVSSHAASMGGSDIWLETGESMTVDELIRATVIMSANDAAVALAEFVSGSEDDFVRAMNEKAAALGMADTTFKNCNGLDEDGHLTSAYDVAVMSRALMQHEKIFDYTTIWIDYLRDGKTQLVNTNKLIRSYNGITGLKTGTTSAAGSCISATAERDGLSLIAVVLGASSTDKRFSDAAALLDFGFANYSAMTPTLPELGEAAVSGGMSATVPLRADAPQSYLVPKGSTGIVSTLVLPETLEAPILPGDVVGSIEFTSGETKLGSQPVYAAEGTPEISVGAVFRLLLSYVCCL